VASNTRSIGPVGTALRVLGALALLYIAGGAEGLSSWAIEPEDAVLGLLVFPAIMVGVGLVARRRGIPSLHYTGPIAHVVNAALIVVLIVNPYTGGGATIFYATAMLIAAWRGQPGCEGTTLSNWILGRNDQIGCPVFSPIDEAERYVRERRTAPVTR
jgi:hypothetical protein